MKDRSMYKNNGIFVLDNEPRWTDNDVSKPAGPLLLSTLTSAGLFYFMGDM